MPRCVLDTCVLIRFWREQGLAACADRRALRSRARELAKFHASNFIVSPVYLEMVAGATNSWELSQTRVLLSEFKVLDGWDIRPEDLLEARRLAERVPANGRKRHLGDCLIAALAQRFRCRVVTSDLSFR